MGVARPSQNLAPAGKDPRERKEQYRSKWAEINSIRGLNGTLVLTKDRATNPELRDVGRDLPASFI